MFATGVINVWAAPTGGLGALLPALPQVQIEYDWTCTAPSADNKCDGHLQIWTWLHLTARIPLDATAVLVVDRNILPTHWNLRWEFDTSPTPQVGYCPGWKPARQRGVANNEVLGHYFNHGKIELDPDPPDHSGTALQATTKYSWTSSLVPVNANLGGAIQVPVAGPAPVQLGVTTGMSSARYEESIRWVIDRMPGGSQAEFTESLNHEVITTAVSVPLYCSATAGSATLRKGTGAQVLADEIQVADSLELVGRP